jgi:DNA-binding NarL/FixJ family response regulator
MPIRILLADDHTLFREMLRDLLPRKGRAYVIVGEAADGLETLDLVTYHHPDLLLLDYKMPGLGRLSIFCKEVAQQSPATRILILSGYGEEEVALEAAVGGAQGYALKGAPISDLLSAIATIHAGGVWVDPHLSPQVFHTFLRYKGEGADNLGRLSRQELRVLSLLAQGMSNKEIGAHLHISQKTVKNHLTHVFAKLGVAGRQQAVLYFLAEKNSAG